MRIHSTRSRSTLTRSAEPLTWANSVALRADIATEVARLKLLLQGSSGLIQTLLANDLIDEFSLLVFPLVLGRGKRLFGEGTIPAALKLVESRSSTTGVIMAKYAHRRDHHRIVRSRDSDAS